MKTCPRHQLNFDSPANAADFVAADSIVRKIWGKSDTILFIFAGAAAEFALNKAVDWPYFTGKLPNDPLGRLFTTVSYARVIIFSKEQAALKAIDSMAGIHLAVEKKRNATIPDWAYRDVLFMLIDYSIASYELLERKLSFKEKQEVFDVFLRVGNRMGISGLPSSFSQWEIMRVEHLEQNLKYSSFTIDLFKQYRKHLGILRYPILLESQKMVAPKKVRKMLGFNRIPFFVPVLAVYKLIRILKLDSALKKLILPSKYQQQIKALDIVDFPN